MFKSYFLSKFLSIYLQMLFVIRNDICGYIIFMILKAFFHISEMLARLDISFVEGNY